MKYSNGWTLTSEIVSVCTKVTTWSKIVSATDFDLT